MADPAAINNKQWTQLECTFGLALAVTKKCRASTEIRFVS